MLVNNPRSHPDPPHPSPYREGTQSEQDEWNRNTKMFGEEEIKAVKSFLAQYKCGQDEDKTYKSHQRLINWLTFAGLVLYAGFTAWQAWETKETAKAAVASNELTQDAVRARIVITGVRFMREPIPGFVPALSYDMANIGQSEGIVGHIEHASRWASMPDGKMPLSEPDVSIVMEPKVPPLNNSIYGEIPDTQAFLDGLPTIIQAGRNQPIPSTYFYGKVVYETLGRRHVVEYCSFMVRQDTYSRQYQAMTEPSFENYFLYKCPKWNSSN